MASSATVSWAAIILWRWFAEKFCTLVLHSGPCAELYEVMNFYPVDSACAVSDWTFSAFDNACRGWNSFRAKLRSTILPENSARHLLLQALLRNLSSSARRLMQSDPHDFAQHYARVRIEPFLFFRTFSSHCTMMACRIEFRVRNIRCTEYVWKAE